MNLKPLLFLPLLLSSTPPRGNNLDFESILIEGHRKRAELSLVTADLAPEGESILKIRKDFLDFMALGLGVDIQP